MKTWQTTHNGHQIRVENGCFTGERLIVDGEMQDEQIGISMKSRLYGRLKNGNGTEDSIKVSIGGWWIIGCRVFVGDRLIYSGS